MLAEDDATSGMSQQGGQSGGMGMMHDNMNGMSQQGGAGQSGGKEMVPGKMDGMSQKGEARQPGGMSMGMMDDDMGGMSGQGMGMMPPTMERMRAMMGGGAVAIPLQHVEGRLAYIMAELTITDPQMPAWHAYAEAVRASSARIRAAYTEAASVGSTAPETTQGQAKILAARLDALKGIEAAQAALYAALSPEQRQRADRLLTGS
ncbi:MAG: Spy/CpxP family protein refolding chaperone, partial [Rhodospirillales bacterium]|nr:Spy/CpxP family protein refolding chaperone [Rhodospirillales bacterium]